MHVGRGTLPVDNAELYYETRGEGVPLLIIQGGLSEVGATDQLAALLASNHQVISYDRRGLSRSTVHSEDPDTSVLARHADDAAQLLDKLSAQPAYVVGASIGALIGLHLAVRHPGLVSTLVAHEPPMSVLVEDPQRQADLDAIEALARDDVIAAIRLMGSVTSGGRDSSEEGARPGPPVGDLGANLRHFFRYDFPAVRTSALGAVEIVAVADQVSIVPTGGADSRHGWEHRCAETLARSLGRELIEMPGGHNGLVSHPHGVSARLAQIFAEGDAHHEP